MDWERLDRLSVGSVDEVVNRWETRERRAKVDSRSALVHYREKEGIWGESYDNNWGL